MWDGGPERGKGVVAGDSGIMRYVGRCGEWGDQVGQARTKLTERKRILVIVNFGPFNVESNRFGQLAKRNSERLWPRRANPNIEGRIIRECGILFG